MKILVLNCGSSSVKYKLFDTHGESADVLAEGGVEKIGLPGGFLKYKKTDGSKETVELGHIDHRQAIEAIFDVKVTKVNTLNVKPKPKRMRYQAGKTRTWKKAMVTLKDGDTIEIFAS